LAGALSFDEKIRQSAALFWLRNDEIFYVGTVIKEQAGGLDSILYEAAQDFDVF
jgi:hypothetical protein